MQFHLFYEIHSNMEFGERIYNLRYNLTGIYKTEYFRILDTYSVHDYYKVLKHLLAFDSSISGNSLVHVENILSHCCCDICNTYYDRVKYMHFSYLGKRECRTKQTPYKIDTMKCLCKSFSLRIIIHFISSAPQTNQTIPTFQINLNFSLDIYKIRMHSILLNSFDYLPYSSYDYTCTTTL